MFRKRNVYWILAFAALTVSTVEAQDGAVKLLPIKQVRLLESPFLKAQSLNRDYLLALDANRLLAPFLREAGLPAKAASYTNWENSGLDGHTAGHYLSGLALLYASTADKTIQERLEYVLTELQRCQDALGTGYIGGVPGSTALWQEISNGDIRAGNFDLNGKWVPLYNIHKTFAGLRDAYQVAGYSAAKDMLIKMTDWAVNVTDGLSDAQMQDMLRSEHGGLNEIFADVALWTKNPAHARLAKRFTQESFLQPLLSQEDHLTGMHANTQIPKVIGIERVADLEDQDAWHDAAQFFWETVVQHRSVAIGGNSTYEHFHPSDDFSSMISSVEGPETCNTYNMLKLSAQLFQRTGDVRYADYYERALYNHILSSQHPQHGGLVYFTPMRPAHYRVYSQPQTSFWCCVGSGLESHSKYGEFIYAEQDQALWVNLFIPSVLTWESKGVRLVQQHQFPNTDTVNFKIHADKAQKFTLHLRKPKWTKGEHISLFVNGKKQIIQDTTNGYLAVERKWKDGDEVKLVLPMHVELETLPDNSPYLAFNYGPVVLAGTSAAQEDIVGLRADDSRGGHIAKGKQVSATEIPLLVGDTESLAHSVDVISAKELRFALQAQNANGEMQTQVLQPFAQIHDARYQIYWPYAESQQEATRYFASVSDAYQERLEKLTIDQVRVGQQQPESDHGIRSEASSTGADNGTQWRMATGWFGYQLSNPSADAKYLYVHYFTEGVYDFTITANDLPIATIRSKAGETAQQQIIALPATLKSEQEITLRITANDAASTAKLTDVRLLKDNPSGGRVSNF
ncbi:MULTISPECIES: glycoside hydrolase family 127 protein [Sphingobacterium]|uniref:Beta-L-arabinofuranosidase domain-containing protein n=1 Tax=Sphingobacterium populi TaxID=1812824 RepID=A0ABW5UFI5_9SPHI|nr:glycoside hydrolase family 127 protein [Sphingobacterium sp. CFCC 11742]